MNEELIARLDKWAPSAAGIDQRLLVDAATALRAADAEIARLTDERNMWKADYTSLMDSEDFRGEMNERYRAAITAALARMPNSVTDAYDILSDALSAAAPVSQPSEAHSPDAPEPAALSDEPTDAERAEVVTVCGSTKFKTEILAEVARLTMDGRLVISLGVFGHTDLPDYNWDTDASDLKTMLDALHRQKIDMAGSVHVVNPGGYYGESTAREIEYARSLGKPVTFMVEAGRKHERGER